MTSPAPLTRSLERPLNIATLGTARARPPPHRCLTYPLRRQRQDQHPTVDQHLGDVGKPYIQLPIQHYTSEITAYIHGVELLPTKITVNTKEGGVTWPSESLRKTVDICMQRDRKREREREIACMQRSKKTPLLNMSSFSSPSKFFRPSRPCLTVNTTCKFITDTYICQRFFCF